MREDLLPLFPLAVVLLPRTPLPLHIFEERYKLMIGEAIRDGSEFGIIYVKDGDMVTTGCTAVVEEVLKQYPDGKLDIMTRGMRRFRVVSLNEDKDYLQAKVQYFEDTPDIPDEALRSEAVERFRTARHMTGQALAYEPNWNEPQLSFQLAQLFDDLDILQKLLDLQSEAERLKELVSYFPIHVLRWRHIEEMRRKAPTNGKSKFIPTTFT